MLKKGGLTALLLFGMFFGAGNLTFPPQLGFESGGHFWPAIAGFVLSGVGIAILTLVIGTLNPKGYIHEISQKISPKFALVYLAVLYLSIGPFFAIPRTAAAAFSIGFSPLIGSGHTNLWLLAFTVIYFALALWIAMNPSKILDSIGRILLSWLERLNTVDTVLSWLVKLIRRLLLVRDSWKGTTPWMPWLLWPSV